VRNWKPSAKQKADFALKMQNPNFVADREAKQERKQEKRIAASAFDYPTAGGKFIPTLQQHDYALGNMRTAERLGSPYLDSFRAVTVAYVAQIAVSHDDIHRVNTVIRNFIEGDSMSNQIKAGEKS